MSEVEVDVRDQRGALALRAAMRLGAGWTVLFGPSGAGKSTVLRMIAGLERPRAGRIVIAGVVVTDVERRIWVPAHLRGVRMVAQRPGLFPEKTVRGNVWFGATDGARVREAVRLCRVETMMDRRIADLSGGERQRVALARALAADGMRCLLLDEPFTGLDGALRDDLLAEVRAWLEPQGVPVVLVTHDVGEVFGSEGRVVRMREGQVAAEGSANEVLARERETLLRRLEVRVHSG